MKILGTILKHQECKVCISKSMLNWKKNVDGTINNGIVQNVLWIKADEYNYFRVNFDHFWSK
jgi:hypothetical protein